MGIRNTLSEETEIGELDILLKRGPVSKNSVATLPGKLKGIDIIVTARIGGVLGSEETSSTTQDNINNATERVAHTNLLKSDIGLKVTVIDVRNVGSRSGLIILL